MPNIQCKNAGGSQKRIAGSARKITGSEQSSDPDPSAWNNQEDFVYLGIIENDVTNFQGTDDTGNYLDGIPKENFQANHPIVGAKVYQYGDDIVVEIEGKYWLYETINDNTLDEQSELSEEEKMQLDPFYGAGIDGNPDWYAHSQTATLLMKKYPNKTLLQSK